MRILETPLEGVVLVEPRVFGDARGFFVETYRADRYAAAGIPGTFVQDNHSQSVRNTLRGLHWQWRRPQGKLVRVIEGSVFDVAVDLRLDSSTFGHWYGTELSAQNFRQIYAPPGFAHGFCVTSDVAQVEYKCTDFYDPDSEAGLAWNDPDVGIGWPVTTPILSARDQSHPRFVEVFGKAPARKPLSV
jgi:dTDP-4-dehydrorhamnose 3,5-epimerase